MALYGLPHVEDDADGLRSTDIGALRRDDTAHAYEAALDPASASLLVVGDSTEKALRPLLEKAFGAWHGHGKHAAPSAVRPTVTTTSPRIVVVDHPGSQSVITFGGEGPRYATPDWAPALALRMIVNGSKGRAAIALHDLGPLASAGALDLSASPSAPRVTFGATVATGRTGDAITEIDRLMRATKTAEIAPREIDDARLPLVTKERSWNTTLAAETDILEGIVVQGLSPDDVTKHTARIEAVTPDDVRRVAARYLDPDRMKVVVVGDWSKIRQQLVDLGWGPVEVRDSSGAVVPSQGTR
jgi:zinc protease